MGKIFIFGVQHQSYSSRNGDTIERLMVHYFDPAETNKSRFERGFRLLNQDVIKNFDFNTFKNVPGLYHTEIEPVRGIGGKLQSEFSSIEFLEPFELDRSASGYLVLAIKKIDFKSEKGDSIKGLKLFFINPRGYISDDNTEGYLPLEAFLSTAKVGLSHVPGFYNLKFDEIRGARGISMARVIPDSISLIAPFENLTKVAA